ncbi:cytochrome P450 [Mycena filopes]|nr:cytochrome P450 [Mycena filopes]
MSALWSPFTLAGLIPLLLIYVLFRRRSIIRNIPGPRRRHTLQLIMGKEYGHHEFMWQKLYGPVYRVNFCFGQNSLMVSDPVALHYILNSPGFKVTPILENRRNLLFGSKSLLCLNAKEHKRLRAALNVGFTAAAVRRYQAAFERAAARLSEDLDNCSPCPDKAINVCLPLSLAALSAISEAVLGQSREDLGHEFMRNNMEILAMAGTQSRAQIIIETITSPAPIWAHEAALYLPAFKVVRASRRLARELGNRVVQEKVVAARNGLDTDGNLYGQLLNLGDSGSAKTALAGDVLAAQTALIMIAGQDTTSITLALGLRELAKMPKFQDELRAEVAANRGNTAYDSMPLLNAFIKEMLRLYPALPLQERIAVEDANIPLGQALTTSTGEQISQIFIEKGQTLIVAIASFQRLESRWGEDASEFNPNRWLDGSANKGGGEAIGPYANLLAFLGGPHNCLGWRFAILEMQIFICELVGKFSFALPENESVRVRFVNTLTPWMANGKKGAPLIVTRVV